MNPRQRRRVQTIQYWQYLNEGQKFIIEHRENFKQLAKTIGRDNQTIMDDIASVSGSCTDFFITQLNKPRQSGAKSMKKQLAAEKHDKIKQYWDCLDGLSTPITPQQSSELIRHMKATGRDFRQVENDAKTLGKSVILP